MLAIIGTALRGDDYDKLTIQKWNKANAALIDFIDKHDVWNVISGGAAGFDHAAVRAYLKGHVATLSLRLPAKFAEGRFFESNFDNTASTANHYHRRFSKKLGYDSLADLDYAITEMEANVKYGNGFFDRNAMVADEATQLIAFTFGDKQYLKDGGTAHTAKLFVKKNGNSNAWHYDLNSEQLYQLDI